MRRLAGFRLALAGTIATLAVLIAQASPALAAQEAGNLMEGPAQLYRSREPDMEGSIVVYGRVSALGGQLDSDMKLDYSDIFGSGAGFALEGSLLGRTRKWMLGGFLSVGWDQYNGKRNTDDFGDSLKPDGMDILTILVGFKGKVSFGEGFYSDLHLGLGAAHYGAVDGTLTLLGVPMDVHVFKSTTVFAFDFGGRIGYSISAFLIELGLGVRVQGKPQNVDLDFRSSTPAVGVKF